MNTVTIRDLRTKPKQVQDSLKASGEAILTASGRPVAVMIAVNAEDLDETLETLRRARGLEALRALRRQSRQQKLDRMPPGEIDAIIKDTRAKKAARTT